MSEVYKCPVCRRTDVPAYSTGSRTVLVAHDDKPPPALGGRSCKGSHRPPYGHPPLDIA